MTLPQNASVQIASELLGHSFTLEANDTFWSDMANTFSLNASSSQSLMARNSPTEDWATKVEWDRDYLISDHYLSTNVAVGPCQHGAFLFSSLGTRLFLADPRLPENVWAGPVGYAVVTSGSRALGLVNCMHSSFHGGVPEFSMWPFIAEPYNVFGYILRGERPEFLRFAAEQPSNAVVNVTPCLNNSARTPVVEDPNALAQTAIPPRQDDSASYLARAIQAMHGRSVLESDVVECAQRAVAEACAFADRELPNYSPSVMLSDDGVVMLQWRGSDRGVLLIFTGDGTGSFSIKSPGGRYSAGEEFSISSRLPADARAAIESIISS